jgi:hypothetical protein
MTNTHEILSLQIERLCDRLQSATRIEDRRDAARGLKNLSKVIKNLHLKQDFSCLN